MKTRKLFMRAMAVALAVIMVVAAAVPAFAAEIESKLEPPENELSIDIYDHTQNGMNGDSEEHNKRQYLALQIFTGKVNTETPTSDSTNPNNWGATSWYNATLSDIEWGDNIKMVGSEKGSKPRFLERLVTLSSSETIYNLDSIWNGMSFKEAWPQFFDDAGNNVFYEAGLRSDSSAEAFAKFLVGKSNAFLQELCEFLVQGANKKIPEKYIDIMYLNITNDHEGQVSSWDPSLKAWHIDVPAPGYYMVVELAEGTVESEPGQIYGEYILAVVGKQSIYEKAQVPTLEKVITDDNDQTPDTGKGDTVAIGDMVTFQLTGTLPQAEWDLFSSYYYAFNDNLSDGLTFQPGTVSVSIKTSQGLFELSKDEKFHYNEPDDAGKWPNTGFTTGTSYYVIYDSAEDPQSFTIVLKDLKQSIEGKYLNGDPSDTSILLDGGESIIVTYTAVVNEKAKIGAYDNADPTAPDSPNHANYNKAYVEYSNDPFNDSKGETVNQTVHLYTFGLDLEKVGSDEKKLEGAGFLLYNKDHTKVATFTDGTDANNGYRLFSKWNDVTTVNSLIEKFQSAEEEYSKHNAENEAELNTNLQTAKNALKDYLLTSQTDGKFYVAGLAAGEYYLSELVVPNGYSRMADFYVKIEVAYNDNGTLKSLTYTYGDSESAGPEGKYSTTVYTVYVNPEDGNTTLDQQEGPWASIPLLTQTLVNEKAPFLPFTGGVGTIVFYAAGGVLIVGALIYLVIASKKRKNRTDA